ncbi:MAG TPA: transcriptional regulator [Chloroflexi bacterium]|nr:transcriptional regulator [Chloroflexota bacterium]
MSVYERMATIFKALAHPVRLQILEILQQEGEACVCHLESILGKRQAYISQQLSKLRDAGLVVDRREGLNIFYALTEPDVGPLLEAAREHVAALAAAEGIHLAVDRPIYAPARPCKCPRCEPALHIPGSDETAMQAQ